MDFSQALNWTAMCEYPFIETGAFGFCWGHVFSVSYCPTAVNAPYAGNRLGVFLQFALSTQEPTALWKRDS